jgi:hypothetical protein
MLAEGMVHPIVNEGLATWLGGRATSVEIQGAIKLFDRIRAAHPGLHMILDTNPQHVDLEMMIPVQEGLPFRVSLTLQGDELHLRAGDHFWVEWFPCHATDVVNRYSDAVSGLLTGRYRIVESFRRGKAVRAELQGQEEDGWKVLTAWSRLHVPLPRRTTERILMTAYRPTVG